MSVKRILFVCVGNETYGMKRATVTLARELRCKGYTIKWISLGPGEMVDALREGDFDGDELGVRVPDSKFRGSLGYFRYIGAYILMLAGVALRVRAMVGSHGANLIYFRNNPLLPIVAFAIAGRRLPALWHMPNEIERGRWLGLQKWVYQLVCRISGIIPTANSRYTARTLGSCFVRTEVLYPSTDCDLFSEMDDHQVSKWKEKWNLRSSVPTFSIVARIAPSKGQLIFARAAVRALREGKCFSVVFAGGPLEGRYAEELKRVIASSNYASAFVLLGPLSDPRPAFGVASVVVNTRVNAEPFGNSIVEALMMGKPVLAYSLGGPSEIITHGVDGWLIDDPSEDGFYDGICQSLSAVDRWAEMSRAAQAGSRDRFSNTTYAERFEEIVSRIQ